MLRALLVAGLLTGPACAAPASAWLKDRTAGMHEVQGRYVNVDYGFSVMPPPGAVAYMGDAPNPNHGVVLILGERRMITVRAEYNETADDGIKSCAANLAEDEHMTMLRGVGTLANRPACIITFMDHGKFQRVIEQQGSDRSTGIVYTVSLTTTVDAKTLDLAALQRTAGSFRHVRIVP